MSRQNWRERQDAKEAAAEALRDVGKSTHLPQGLRWMTGDGVQLQSLEIRHDEQSER